MNKTATLIVAVAVFFPACSKKPFWKKYGHDKFFQKDSKKKSSKEVQPLLKELQDIGRSKLCGMIDDIMSRCHDDLEKVRVDINNRIMKTDVPDGAKMAYRDLFNEAFTSYYKPFKGTNKCYNLDTGVAPPAVCIVLWQMDTTDKQFSCDAYAKCIGGGTLVAVDSIVEAVRKGNN